MNATVELSPATPLAKVFNHKLFYMAYIIKGISTPLVLHIKTGSHATAIETEASVGVSTTIDILEGATPSVDGTPIVLMNYNRLYPDDSLAAKVFVAPTYTGGSNILTALAGFGTNSGKAQGGQGGEPIPYIMKPFTSYIHVLTPLSVTDMYVRWCLCEED